MFEEFSSLLSQICSRSCLAIGRPLVWNIIANPCAGGFTIRSRWKKHYSQLLECVRKAEKNPMREGRNGNAQGLFFTEAVGSAGEITNTIIKDAEASIGAMTGEKQPFYLIICAGGDGTSRDIMTSIYYASSKVRDNFAILRLPMGTGNDGADTWELNDALDLLIEPSTLVKQRVLQLKTASNKGPFLAFNILSVGADAFVTHMTNKTKGKLPGDSYKIWVDIAALFYDLIYKVGYMDVLAMDNEGKEIKRLKEKLLLLAVGESGRRTYGSHKWILPDERNVCAIKQMPLFKKIALKNTLNHGGHVDKPEAILWNAMSVEFSAQYPLLAQMDGETVLLKEGDFPASIELSNPIIPILQKVKV